MNENEWKKVQAQKHIRDIVFCYSKIKSFFQNEKTLDKNRDDEILEYGIDRIKSNLIQLKAKLEKYRKTI